MNTNEILFNQSFDKKRLKALIEWVFKTFGEKEALRIVEDLKKTGFRNATRAGISLGLHELTTPPDKPFLISNAQIAMNMTHSDFISARITATERSQRIVDTWHRISDTLRKQVVDYFSTYDKLNPIYIMALSGARGNFSQVRQLVGMRGLMADPQGQIISFPIRSNLREGLTLTEYFISCSGARKGLVDTALRTADTGYLTRRLVDVSHHIVVKRVACNTHKGILIRKLQSNNKTLLSLKDRLIGRVLAEDINLVDQNDPLILKKEKPKVQDRSFLSFKKKNLNTNNFLAQKDQEIFPDLAVRISNSRQEVLIRSPLTCAFNHELCQLCYGWSLSQGNLVPLGEAVGVIAAQSIGEPGTQLTMRTFHTGGVFSGDLLQEIRASHSGKICYLKAVQGLLIRTTHGKIAFLTKTSGEIIVLADPKSTSNQQLGTESLISQKTCFSFQNLSMLFVRQGEYVEKNQLLAEVSDFGDEGNQSINSQQTIFAELSGQVIEIQGGGLTRNELEKEEEENKGNEENESLQQIEPEKSGQLGLFQLLSIGIGATFNPCQKFEKMTLTKSLDFARNVNQPFISKTTLQYSPKNLCLAKNKLLTIKQNVSETSSQFLSKKITKKQIHRQNFHNSSNYSNILPPFSGPFQNSKFGPFQNFPAAAGVLPIFSVFTPTQALYTFLLEKQKKNSLIKYQFYRYKNRNDKNANVSFRQALTLGLNLQKKLINKNTNLLRVRLKDMNVPIDTKVNKTTYVLRDTKSSSKFTSRQTKVSETSFQKYKSNRNLLKSSNRFYLHTIAEEGDLVTEDYKKYTYPQK